MCPNCKGRSRKFLTSTDTHGAVIYYYECENCGKKYSEIESDYPEEGA